MIHRGKRANHRRIVGNLLLQATWVLLLCTPRHSINPRRRPYETSHAVYYRHIRDLFVINIKRSLPATLEGCSDIALKILPSRQMRTILGIIKTHFG